ncbi:MAG: hypothetical protein K5647_10840 [Clostridiales bacterium]|nr:hypothetical protein [Clostridiales bacterium]
MATVAKRRQKIDMPKSIKNKFAAALCMLLVGAIMMVSASYAWFTLSTAPEVKGITTNVGANGNLEIMLLDGTGSLLSDASNLGVEPNIGDSMESQLRIDANRTWGNLVDLSDSYYGLSDIILAPAALNITNPDAGSDVAKIIDKIILKVPSYGADGRVQNVREDTTLGYKSSTSFNVQASDAQRTGVSAIGSNAGVSARLLAYINARQGVESAKNSAKDKAQSSLVSNAASLANTLMNLVIGSEGQTFTRDQIVIFNVVLSDLNDANEYVLQSIKQAAIAYAIGTDDEMTEAQISTMRTAVLAAATLSDLETALGDIAVPSDITTAWNQYASTKTAITNARTYYDNLTADESVNSFTEDQVRALLNTVLNKAAVQIGGFVDPTRAQVQEILNNIGEDPLEITLLEGSGIFYEIAKSTGSLSVSGIRVSGINATMSTSGVSADGTLGAVLQLANDSNPEENEGDALAMSDLFGYIIDLGFRTNAAGSNLLLQGSGTQRIYNSADSSVTNVLTQGAGTYISFSSDDTSKFDAADIIELMGAVRLVFVTPIIESGEITGYTIIHMAAPDLSDIDATSLTDTVTAPIAFYSFTSALVDPNAGEDDREVIVTLGDKIDTDIITPLEQNVAKKISVIVYLDGDVVDNTMVANAKTSMTGKLNLQFASDADLVPMDVASLKNALSVADLVSALEAAVPAIKADDVYTAAEAAMEPNAAEDPTEEQRTLVAAVAEAEAALAATTQVDEDIIAAARALKAAAAANGLGDLVEYEVPSGSSDPTGP